MLKRNGKISPAPPMLQSGMSCFIVCVPVCTNTKLHTVCVCLPIVCVYLCSSAFAFGDALDILSNYTLKCIANIILIIIAKWLKGIECGAQMRMGWMAFGERVCCVALGLSCTHHTQPIKSVGGEFIHDNGLTTALKCQIHSHNACVCDVTLCRCMFARIGAGNAATLRMQFKTNAFQFVENHFAICHTTTQT